jgi:myo-inositol-1(or 4)-monophosphatase
MDLLSAPDFLLPAASVYLSPMPDIQTYLTAAADIARAAGIVALERQRGLGPAQFKGTKDLVTEADLECDRLIRARLTASFPDHDLLTEEEGALNRGSDYRWIADPIDGTINYSHGIPLWGNSVALTHKGQVLCGAIYLPVFDELYTVSAGGGAFLNGRPLQVSPMANITAAVLSHGDYNVGDDDIRDDLNADNRLAHGRMTQAVQRIKCLGSAVVEGAWVASGRLDGYFMTYLKPWDVAVTTLLVAEAGGRVTDLRGNPWALGCEEALFSNATLHDELVSALNWERVSSKGVRWMKTTTSSESSHSP